MELFFYKLKSLLILFTKLGYQYERKITVLSENYHEIFTSTLNNLKVLADLPLNKLND